MHYATLNEITTPYDLICVSAHLDDAALSCGGQLLAARQAGLRTLVVTACTAVPPVSASYSDLAVEFHREWGLDEAAAVTTRLGEDRHALAILGADDIWLNLDDAIYRMPQHYNSRETLFAMPHPSDQLAQQLVPILAQLATHNPQSTWLIPAGVGMHVDHLNVFAAARQVLGTANVRFYEEVPYALDASVIAYRRAMLTPTLHASAMGSYLAAKIAAVNCYASQMAALFGDPATMPDQLTAYHRAIGGDGPAERWYELSA